MKINFPQFNNFYNFKSHIDEIIVIASLLDYDIYSYKTDFNYLDNEFDTSWVLKFNKNGIDFIIRTVYKEKEFKFVEIRNINENTTFYDMEWIEHALQRIKEML